jgi:hypothetical protein
MKTIRGVLTIAALVIAGSYLYQHYGAKKLLGHFNTPTQQFADNVLGAATKQVVEQTQGASGQVQSVIYKQTAIPLVDQFKKLPSGQQEEIKRQICPK